jgi:hypothetical protein
LELQKRIGGETTLMRTQTISPISTQESLQQQHNNIAKIAFTKRQQSVNGPSTDYQQSVDQASIEGPWSVNCGSMIFDLAPWII